MAGDINIALNKYFPVDLFNEINKSSKSLKIIAELGTYFTTSSYSLCVNIISKKVICQDLKEFNVNEKKQFVTGSINEFSNNDLEKKIKIDYTKKIVYCINDSVHASFKWYSMDLGLPIFLRESEENLTFYHTSIGGATCDSSDFVIENYFMPELEIGDYLMFKNMGSYTKTGNFPFDILQRCLRSVSGTGSGRYQSVPVDSDRQRGLSVAAPALAPVATGTNRHRPTLTAPGCFITCLILILY
jgi:ornithine decarboxylase